jgi:hypothetical protein
MKADSVAPCGVICDLCYGFQRNENRCSEKEGDASRFMQHMPQIPLYPDSSLG